LIVYAIAHVKMPSLGAYGKLNFEAVSTSNPKGKMGDNIRGSAERGLSHGPFKPLPRAHSSPNFERPRA
jgi:hypothetical protein